MSAMWICLKRNSLILLDEISSADVIPLIGSLQLHRIDESIRNQMNNNSQESNEKIWLYSDVNRTIWMNYIFKQTIDVFSTHNIRMNVNKNELTGNRNRL